MNLIDLRMVMLLTGLMSGFMAMMFYSLKRSYPASIKGLGEWSAGLMVLFLACALASTKNILPEFLSVTCSVFLLLIGIYLNYFGTQRFFGVQPRIGRWVGVMALALLGSMWLTWIEPSYLGRLRLFITLMAVLFGFHAHLVWRRSSMRLAKILTLIAFMGMFAIFLARLVGSFLFAVGDEVLDMELRHLIFITCFSFSIFLSSTSMVHMASDRLHAELQYLATHDPLTNALTRRHMNDECMTELARCRRHGHSMALLMMDLDNFKAVNDHYGHQAGDRVLVDFVARVNALLRQPDQLGRFGGEEFVVLLPETTLAEALVVAERIRVACDATGSVPDCTVSIGVTTYEKDSDTMDALLARADAAMYRAKTKGRNRVEIG